MTALQTEDDALRAGYTVKLWAANSVGRDTFEGYVLMRPRDWAELQSGELDKVPIWDVDSAEPLMLIGSWNWTFEQE